MSLTKRTTINNYLDTSCRRILTWPSDTKRCFLPSFIYLLFRQFLPPSPMENMLFIEEVDVNLDDYNVVDPALLNPKYIEDTQLDVTLYEFKTDDYYDHDHDHEIDYIKYDGKMYKNNINIDLIQNNQQFIDFLLSYQDNTIVTNGNFTTSFLQKLVGLTFGSLQYTEMFMIKLFKYLVLTPNGEQLWHTASKQYIQKNLLCERLHRVDSVDINGIFYIIYSDTKHICVINEDNVNEQGSLYYSILFDDLVELSHSIPECMKFIESQNNEIYKIKQIQNNIRIKHLLSFELDEGKCEGKMLFKQRIPGLQYHTSENGFEWHGGYITVYENYFQIDYDKPSILFYDDVNTVSSRIGKWAFTPSNWKDDTIKSTLIYQNWYLNITETYSHSENVRINCIHPDLLWSFESEYHYLKVSFPKDRIFEELLKYIYKEITREECCEFTQIILDKKSTIEQLEKDYNYDIFANHDLYYSN